MNNKSHLLSSLVFVLSSITLIGCNQSGGYDVTFNGENCAAKCIEQSTPSSSFTFKGEANKEIVMTVQPNATYTLNDLVMTIGGKEAIPGKDYFYTSIAGSFDKTLNFVVSSKVNITVKATKPSDLEIKSTASGFTFTKDKEKYSAGDTATLTLDVKEGYNLPTTYEEMKDMIYLKGGSTGNKYEYNYDVTNKQMSFVMPVENVVISGEMIKKTYHVTDISQGCLLDIGGLDIAYHTLVTANIILAPGYEAPLSKEMIYITTSEGELVKVSSYVGGNSPYFTFIMPGSDITIATIARSRHINVTLTPNSEGVTAFIDKGPFHRGDHVNVRVIPLEGYELDEHTTVLVQYFDVIGEAHAIDDYNWVPSVGVLSFNIPDPILADDFDVVITIIANKIPHNINVNVDNVSADNIIITANEEERDPAHYYINDEIEITLTTNPGYQLPLYKGEFHFTNIDQDDITYVVEEVAEDFTQTGTLTFTMPAKDVAISTTPTGKYSALPFSHTIVTASNILLNGTLFAPGSVVTGTIIPDTNYVIPEYARAIFFFDSNDVKQATPITSIPVTYDPTEGGTFSFIMPSQNIYVGAICHRNGPLNVLPFCDNELTPVSISGTYGQTITLSFVNPSSGYHIATDMTEFLSTHYVIGDYVESDLSYSVSAGIGTLTVSPLHSGLYIIGSAPADNP